MSFGAALLAVGALTIYRQLVVEVSHDAIINARVTIIRAPIEGVVAASVNAPGTPIRAGAAIGQVEDPRPDDARLFELVRQADMTEQERGNLSRRLGELQRAREQADAQAEAYRLGRVQQDEYRVAEAQAAVAAAIARETEATANALRSDALAARGFEAVATRDRATHAQQVAQAETVAARKRLDALEVELQAARAGTYLGDSYNDVPSSFQRARELALRIDETRGALDDLGQKKAKLAVEVTTERERVAARSAVVLVAPGPGQLWTSEVASGEFVRKGQELFAVLDCSTVLVTASVSPRQFNALRFGDAVRFRILGTRQEYAGQIIKLGLGPASGSFAIPPDPSGSQIAVAVPELADGSSGCLVGQTGTVTFEGHTDGLGIRLAQALNAVRRLL